MQNDLVARRLERALYDLGLDRVLGSGWFTVTDRGLEFADLDARRADRLIRALEGIAEQLPSEPPALPGTGQLAFPLPEESPAERRARFRVVTGRPVLTRS